MYNSNYKVCVGEEKEAISTDKLSCYYSTYYAQSFGPITFTKDKPYIALITTQRKFRVFNFSLTEYQEQYDENSLKADGKKIVSEIEYNLLLSFLVIFAIIAVAAVVITFLFIRKVRSHQEEHTSDFLKQNFIP